MRKRIGELPISADAYGRSLKGLGINLIVTSIEAARPFHTEVLGAEEVYSDSDFAAYIRRLIGMIDSVEVNDD